MHFIKRRVTFLRCALAASISLGLSEAASAQWNINSAAGSYLIDFSTTVAGVNEGPWAGTGFQATPATGQLDSDAWALTGWSNGALTFGGTQITTNTDFTRGVSSAAGGVSTGGMYAFSGNGIPAGVALGIQPGSGDWAPGTITLKLQNTTGSTITGFDLSYLLYVRNNELRSNSFNFSTSADDTTYSPISALDYTSTAAADTTPVFVSNLKSTSLSGLSIANGAFYYLRWNGADVGGSGSRDEFALDNIQLGTITTASSGGTPALAAAFSTGDGVFSNLLLGATATKDVTLTASGATVTSITDNGPVAGLILTPTSPTAVNLTPGQTTTAQITVDTGTAGSKGGPVNYTPNGGVASNSLTVSANVNTATYGTQMTAATPLNYVTPSIGLASTGNGTAGSGNPPALNSTAKITNYTNSSGSDTAVNMTWRLRTPDEASNVSGLNDNGNLKSGYLVSDVVNITGMDNGNGITDTFVLTMSYNAALLNGHEDLGIANGTIFIGWKNGSNEWVKAVLGNNNGTGTGSYKGDTDFVAGVNVLGDFGIDKATSTVWAVLNHNSEFAVIPEPSTMVLGSIAMLGFAGLGLRRRRMKSV